MSLPPGSIDDAVDRDERQIESDAEYRAFLFGAMPDLSAWRRT
jgi:hypothetical protein